MRRLHLFEFEDLDWFPGFLRNYITDYLRFVSEKFRIFDPVVPLLVDTLHRTGRQRIVDLASGGGGAWGSLAPKLREEVPDLHVTLTDLYPNRGGLSALANRLGSGVEVRSLPVDATEVPGDLEGLRTQFLSLHHFPPDVATGMLRNAVEAGEPIAIFEAQKRDLEHLLRFALSPLAVLLLTPSIRPVTPGRLAFTYLPPLVPFFVLWDGLVSVLRTYSVEEMEGLAAAADPVGLFRWESGVLTGASGKIQYLIGTPRS